MLTIQLRIILIFVSILTVVYVLWKIRQSKVNLDEGIGWFSIAAVMVVLSIFPQIATFFAKLLGIASPVNMVYLAIIGVLLWKLFITSMRLSSAENRINELAEEIALRDRSFNHIRTQDDRILEENAERKDKNSAT